MLLKVVSEIHDPVTTTDELIPSGETSSYRSNPLGLAEFALSRKDPALCRKSKRSTGRPKKQERTGECPVEALPEYKEVMNAILAEFKDIKKEEVGIGSTILCSKTG